MAGCSLVGGGQGHWGIYLMANRSVAEKLSDAAAERPKGLLARFGNKAAPAEPAAPRVANSALDVREAVTLLRNYEETGQGWFWSTDAEGNIRYLSDSVADRLGMSAAPFGEAFTALFAPPERGEERQRSLPFLLTRKTRFDQVPLRSLRSDPPTWWAVTGVPQFDRAGNFAGYRGFGSDITAQRESAEQSLRLTKYDSLTGLLNRFRMAQLLESTLAAFKPQKRNCAIMLLDLDRFKAVNDTLGHPAGDALLKQVALRLAHVVGDKERVSRLGGDEFQVILPDVDDRGALGELATEIIAKLSEPYSINESRCMIGVSVGVAISPFDGDSSEELVRNADLALYAAKGNGRGRFRFFSDELLRAAADRRALEEDLVDALGKGELEVHYQPVVCTKTDQVSGVEALMRWNHPERGYVSPSLFIPIAEETDLIARLGEWLLRQACKDAASWPGDMRVAVNVSAIQFADHRLPKLVANAIAAAGLPAQRLELEITESVFVNDSPETKKMFSALKDIGVRLALDDFGTGYSSLAYLQSAPFDKIKIDQSFVRTATEKGSRSAAIIAAIVALATTLDMETTAEGIETLDQLDLIRRLNVSHIQGYAYSMAVAQGEVIKRCGSGDWFIKPSGPAKQRHKRLTMFRRAGAVHENHYYPIVVRNLSATGALIEGIIDVPIGTKFVIDFGEGQLAVADVARSRRNQQGLIFEQRLVDDGNGGLCTAHRIPRSMLAAAGLPTSVDGIDLNRLQSADFTKTGLPIFHTENGALPLAERLR
jgi:diguanylate cyclase (GGDEF)-like protein